MGPVTIEVRGLRGFGEGAPDAAASAPATTAVTVEADTEPELPAAAVAVAEVVGQGPSLVKVAFMGLLLYGLYKAAASIAPSGLGALGGKPEWFMYVPPLRKVKRSHTRKVPVRDLQTALRFAQVHARQTGEAIRIVNTKTGQTEIIGPE